MPAWSPRSLKKNGHVFKSLGWLKFEFFIKAVLIEIWAYWGEHWKWLYEEKAKETFYLISIWFHMLEEAGNKQQEIWTTSSSDPLLLAFDLSQYNLQF